MKLEKRSSFGWPRTSAGYAPCLNGLAVHYDGNKQRLASKSHDACRQYWKGVRTFHINGNGWQDIGYSYAVCPHGVVLEGRGWQKEQAAQPGGNTTWTSVTFMSGEGERPTSAQLEAFQELRQWLQGKGLREDVKGHRDFYNTSCPGDVLYSMVKNGSLKEGEDEVSAKDVWEYPIDTGDGKNPWYAKTVLGHLEKEQDAIKGKLAEVDGKVSELIELVKSITCSAGK